MAEIKHPPTRPVSSSDFEIALICALTLEADAVVALFDHHWDDDGSLYDKAPADPNAYSAGAIGRHNVILAHMPGMGKANGAAVAANCRSSFPNIKLAIVVGVCGVVPFDHDGVEIALGDVIVSDGVVQYDLGRLVPERFVQKDTLLDSLGRPNAEIRSSLAKLRGIRGRTTLRQKMVGYLSNLRTEPELAAGYPGAAHDRLFEAAYRHRNDGMSCDECGCNGPLVPRSSLEQGNQQPTVHFGLIASGDAVMKSGEDRDRIARQKRVVAFEMEGAGVWDTFPCVVIKGACDYADSHKSKGWQQYAAATAAACMKAFLDHWGPSSSLYSVPQPALEQSAGPWFLVPYPRNDTFVGRTSILQKLQQLLKPPSRARTSLFGLGGAGKTQIALEYAYMIRQTCMGMSVFWVHGSNAERFGQSYTSIALECRIPGYNDPKVQVLPLVKTWLEREERGPWLMIIDNADDVELFFPPHREQKNASSGAQDKCLGQYVPECARGSILITSRNKQAGQKLAKGKHPIEVNKMDDAEAIRLLRASLEDRDNAADDNELLTLARRLEHLPLALIQAAAFIEANTVAIGRYIHLIDKSDQDRVYLLSKEFETVGRDSEAPRAVAETWILSFLQIQQQYPFASELFSIMSFFDRQAIPIEFLEYYSEQQNQEEYREIQLQETLGILKAFSFVTEGQDQSLDIHRLVQLISRKWLTREKRSEHFANQALSVISQAYPVGVYENWIPCSKYLPHAYQVLKFEAAVSKDEKMGRGVLLHNMALYLLYQGQWNDAERLQLEAMELWIEVLGADHPDTLTSMANLASMCIKQGRWEEAEKLFVQVIETRKAKLGADHPDTLISMANLASTFWNQGRWGEAEKLFVQVMETRKAKLGADHPDTLTSMANLASTYRKQGHWKEAEKLEVQVLEMSKAKLGADHPDTLTSMAHLASTFWDQGRWEEAEKLEVQVLEMSKAKLGADHPDTLTSMANLASTYRNQGRWEEAEKLFVQVLEMSKAKLGTDHPDTLTSMANLASTFWKQGRWEKAEKLEVQVIETRQAKLGADHPNTLTSMANLASTYRKQGRWEEAEKLFVQVIETRKAKLGADHPDTLTSMANLASTFWNQGRWKEAEKLEVQVTETRKAKLGADHPDTLTSMANLASIFWDQGRWEEAEKLEVQVLEISKAKLGADHPDTLISMANLALTYRNQARWEEAEKLEVQVLEISKAKLGADHPDTLTSMANLASTFWDQGRWEEAEKLEVQVMATRQAKLGVDHPDTLTCVANLASTYRNQGRREEAEKLEVQVLEMSKAKLGADHPDTLTSMNNLAHTWKNMGKNSAATELMLECIRLRKQKLGSNHPDTRSSISSLDKWSEN